MAKIQKTARSETASNQDEADRLQVAIRALGEFAHVSVKTSRGHLNIFAGDDLPVARLTPLGGGQYGLSFMRSTGRWEPMPFTGDITDMPSTIVTTLAPYLTPYELPSGISGSHH